MTNKQMANRIQELEREVKELQEQILTLALRQPSVVTVPVVNPQPYIQPYIQPNTQPFIPYSPTITGGNIGPSVTYGS